MLTHRWCPFPTPHNIMGWWHFLMYTTKLSSLNIHQMVYFTLNSKSCHGADFVIIGNTVGCLSDNLGANNSRFFTYHTRYFSAISVKNCFKYQMFLPWIMPSDQLSFHVFIISSSCLEICQNFPWSVEMYRQTCNISRTLVGNKIVDHSDACRRCSNCIFIHDLTLGFNGLGKDNFKSRRETFKFWDLVLLILEV